MNLLARIVRNLSKLSHRLFNGLKRHFNVLYNGFDAVKDVCENGEPQLIETKPKGKLNYDYLLPFLLGAYIIVDSAFEFAQNGFHYSPNGMDRLYTHRIFPRQFWREGDVIVGNGVWLMAMSFGFLLFDPMLSPKFKMFHMVEDDDSLIMNPKVPSSEREKKEIVKFRKKYRNFVDILQVIFQIQCQVFFLGNFIWFYWTGDITDYFMVTFSSLFFLYATFNNTALLLFFVLNLRYIQIKQKGKSEKIRMLNLQLMAKSAAGKGNINKTFLNMQMWRQFCSFAQEMTQIYDEIRGQNAFWSKYVTGTFIVYVMDTCYFAYAFLFNQSQVGIMRQFYAFFAVEFMCILLLVTLECSRIVQQNVKVSNQMLVFSHLYRETHLVPVRHLFKLNGLASNHRNIARISFTLTNQYRINSKMFELLFSCIVTFFFMILGNSKKFKI